MNPYDVVTPYLPPPPDRDDPARAPWGILEIFFAVVLTLIALLVISLVFAGLSRAGVAMTNAERNLSAAAAILIGGLAQDAAAVAAAAAVSLRRYRLGPRAWGLRREKPLALGACASVLFASFAVLIGYQVVVTALGIESLKPKENVPPGLLDHRVLLPFAGLFVVFVAPFAEEMFFRGFMFNGLRRRLGVYGAAGLTGLLFGAIHIISGPIGVLIPFWIIGFMFAMLVARTGSLWNSIVVHLAFNMFALLAGLIGGGPGVLVAALAVAMVFFALNLLVVQRAASDGRNVIR